MSGRAFAVSLERSFDRPAAEVFDAWTDPALRAAFETPEGSGLVHEALDCRPGGREVLGIFREGARVGEARVDIHVVRPPEGEAPGLLLAQGRTVIGGAVHLAMQTAVEVAPEGEGTAGCRLTGTSQIVAPTGAPGQDEVRASWEGMLDRFAAALEDR